MRIRFLATMMGVSGLLVAGNAFAEEPWYEDGQQQQDAADDGGDDEADEADTEVDVEAAPPPERTTRRRHVRRHRGDRVRGPRTIPAEDGVRPPPGYYLKRKSLVGVWATGIPVLAVGYLVSVVTTAIGATDDCWDGCSNGPWGVGLIPLVGSLANAANDDFNEGARIAYGFATVLQTAGFAMIVAGASIRKSVWVRQRYYSQGGEQQAEVTGKVDLNFGGNFIGVTAAF